MVAKPEVLDYARSEENSLMDSGLLVNLFACIIGVCLYVLVLQALNRMANTLVEIRDILKSQGEPLHLALKYLDNIDESLRPRQDSSSQG
jgi:hypothetical protein